MPSLRRRSLPERGELWISRPPFSLTARVLNVDPLRTRIEYQLIDRDGSPLIEPVRAGLDESWWRLFRPLRRRFG